MVEVICKIFYWPKSPLNTIILWKWTIYAMIKFEEEAQIKSNDLILYFIVMDQVPKIWVLCFGSAMEKWVFKGKLNKIFAVIEVNLPKTV